MTVVLLQFYISNSELVLTASTSVSLIFIGSMSTVCFLCQKSSAPQICFVFSAPRMSFLSDGILAKFILLTAQLWNLCYFSAHWSSSFILLAHRLQSKLHEVKRMLTEGCSHLWSPWRTSARKPNESQKTKLNLKTSGYALQPSPDEYVFNALFCL